MVLTAFTHCKSTRVQGYTEQAVCSTCRRPRGRRIALDLLLMKKQYVLKVSFFVLCSRRWVGEYVGALGADSCTANRSAAQVCWVSNAIAPHICYFLFFGKFRKIRKGILMFLDVLANSCHYSLAQSHAADFLL